MVLKEANIAKQAWKLSDGVHEDFYGRRVVKLPRGKKSPGMVLVMPHLSEWPFNPSSIDPRVEIAVYSKPEHVKIFRRAAKGLRRGGPAERHMGSIGSIGLRVWPTTRNASLAHAQAHFKTSGVYPLERSLAFVYGGWRKRALKVVLEVLHSQGRTLRVYKGAVNRNRQLGKRTPLHRELIAVAREAGTSLCSRRGYFFIPAKNK